ncbi:MAG TPA: SCO family protein [Spirochaetia bacterium]|nr:SCO family protein [Spirochaetia bacterium]
MGCIVMGVAVCREWRLPFAQSNLALGAVGTTVVLFMAIHRYWNNDRRAFARVFLATLLSAAWVTGHFHAVLAQAFIVVLCLSGPSYCLWRFAPDEGQEGWAWAFSGGFVRGLALACLALALPLVGGCGERASAPEARSFELRGEIVDVIPQRHALLIHHDEIPGYMPSMTMEFGVGDADISSFRSGQRVEARLIADSPGSVHLEGIRVQNRLNDSIVAAYTRRLVEDTHLRGNQAFREVGEIVPSFALYDQNGDVVSIERFRGKRIVLNFIYTRCPIATMCPAATARMAELQRLAKARHVTDLELVSITLDPAHDTPPVLHAYAAAHGIGSANFHFLTGPDAAIRNLLVQFGVLVEPGENYLKHTLATILIDRRGKIAYRADGSSWDVEDFLNRR